MEKLFILVGIFLIVLYLINGSESFSLNNELYTNTNLNTIENKKDIDSIDVSNSGLSVLSENTNGSRIIANVETKRAESNSDLQLQNKFITRDTVVGDKFKESKYSAGVRGNAETANELNVAVNQSTELIQPDYMDNDKYSGLDEGEGKFASYKTDAKPKDKYKLDDIFNSQNYLPNKEGQRDDWFEVLPDAISVKNRHLINVSKPIGMNTIGTSLRNASWDIRGTVACPKFVVSPWLQSTIEPDTNLKSLC